MGSIKQHDSADTLVREAIRKMRPGTLFTRASLGPVGSRMGVATALSRMARRGLIRRVSQGLYEAPGGRLDQGRPLPDAVLVAREVARQRGVRIVPTGAYAAYILGIIPHLPDRISFRTDGNTGQFRTGRHTIALRQSTRGRMAAAERTSGVVFEALRYLGRRGATPAVLLRLRERLHKKERVELLRDVRHAPLWMADIVRLIASVPVRE